MRTKWLLSVVFALLSGAGCSERTQTADIASAGTTASSGPPAQEPQKAEGNAYAGALVRAAMAGLTESASKAARSCFRHPAYRTIRTSMCIAPRSKSDATPSAVADRFLRAGETADAYGGVSQRVR